MLLDLWEALEDAEGGLARDVKDDYLEVAQHAHCILVEYVIVDYAVLDPVGSEDDVVLGWPLCPLDV